MRRYCSELFLALVLCSPAFPTVAQEAVEPEPVETPGLDRDVDEITVTGTRSQVTDVQGEAAAITAFGMDDLDRSEIVNVDKLAFNVPSLHIGQAGNDSIITLRGISTENATVTGEPGLQFHVDGVNYARPSAARVAFFDLEGLQVHRGPQGVGGGKNATAGAIHVTTAKPNADFETRLDFQSGSYDHRRLRGSINLPITEYAQTRFAFIQEDRTGFQKNLQETVTTGITNREVRNDKDLYAMDADDLGFRGHLRLLPSDSLEALFGYNFYEQRGVGPGTEIQVLKPHGTCSSIHPEWAASIAAGFDGVPSQQPAFYRCRIQRGSANPFVFPPVLGIPEPALDNGTAARPHRVYKNRVSSQDNRFWGWTGTLNYGVPALPFLGETQLKSISSYQVAETFTDGDRDASELQVFWGPIDKATDQWSQELQWSGSLAEGLWDWNLSLFYLNEQSDSLTDVDVQFGSFERVFIEQEVESESHGLALQTAWHALDDLTFSLGGRYIKDIKKNALLRSNSPALQNILGSEVSSCNGPELENAIKPRFDPANPRPARPISIRDGTPECELTFRQLIGSLGAEWAPLERFDWWPTDETLLYANVSNGFKAGGFAAFEFGTFDPEKIWSFAIGAKNTFWDDRITLNLETFFYNYRDMQQVVVDGFSVRTDNGDAEMSGFEVEWEAEPIPGLRMNGMFSYLDTEFTEYVTFDPVDTRNNSNCNRNAIDSGNVIGQLECLITDFAGNELSRSPKFSYSIGMEYELFLGDYGVLIPRLQWYYQDDTFYRGFNRTPANTGRNAINVDPRLTVAKAGDGVVNDLQEAYHHTDVKLVWRSPADRFVVEAFVLNLEDQSVYQNVQIGSAILGNPGFAWYGAPRTYGFRVGFSY